MKKINLSKVILKTRKFALSEYLNRICLTLKAFWFSFFRLIDTKIYSQKSIQVYYSFSSCHRQCQGQTIHRIHRPQSSVCELALTFLT